MRLETYQGIGMKRRWLAKQHSKDRENSVPSIGDRDPGNAVTREDSSQIADTVDDSGRRRAAFLTTELERDGSRQVGVGPNHQEPDERDQRNRQVP